MRVIMEPVRQVDRICGRQKYKQGEEYRLTRHCLTIGCEEGTLYYHTLTGAMILLGGGETPQEYEKEFVRDYFLVPRDFDERAYAAQVRNILAMLRPARMNKTGFTILTTTDCNARCFYCYEKDARRAVMSERIARDAAAYIARVSGGEKVSLHWFGGEPLMNTVAIDTICGELEKSGTAFTSRITTNGYLFDDELIGRAKTLWRLKSAQITVDGTKDVYQRTKAYINRDAFAYERVLDNIGKLTERGIRVTIRLNMNRKNAGDLMALCDELYDRFGGRELLKVYPVLLKDFAGDVGAFTEGEAAEHFLRLREKLQSRGLYRREKLVRELVFQRCMADNDACEVILPDGRVGKCEHFSDDQLIGSIASDQRDGDMIRSWKEQVSDDPRCAECPLSARCIELKKCPWAKDGCTADVQKLRLEKMAGMALDAYREQQRGDPREDRDRAEEIESGFDRKEND